MAATARRVKIPDMNQAVIEILEEYGDHVSMATKEAVKMAAEIAKKEVRAGAPVRTGKYRRGWTVRENAESRLRAEAVVHNKNRYQLAHLLEHGHRLVLGGKERGRVRAFPHIAIAEEHAVKNMEEALKKIAQG